MRGWSLFLSGLLSGVAIQFALAQDAQRPSASLNHVGISVPDMDAAIHYYTEIMGFPEAFRVSNEAGEPTLVYVQISRDTFLELNRANGRPTGINHLGLEVADIDTAATTFRERGADVSETRSGSTRAELANITSLNGIRIELSEYPPGSLQRDAIDGWR